jgi:hypothetical protein
MKKVHNLDDDLRIKIMRSNFHAEDDPPARYASSEGQDEKQRSQTGNRWRVACDE